MEEFDNLFVVRGTSKFFAAPGLRLGYGVSSNHAFLERLKTNQDPWSVNSLAAFAGERMFSDTAFHQETIALISGTVSAAELFEKLIRKKMLIRDAASFTFLDESYLRFCILSPEQNAALLRELKALVE